MTGNWVHEIVWSVSVDCRNKIMRFFYVFGIMIVNTMIEKGISRLQQVPWVEVSFVLLWGPFRLIVIIKLLVSVVFLEE